MSNITVTDLTSRPLPAPSLTYPTVRRLRETSTGYVGKPVIVLFTSRSEGLALMHPTVSFMRGITEGWTPADDDSHWEPCTVSISSET